MGAERMEAEARGSCGVQAERRDRRRAQLDPGGGFVLIGRNEAIEKTQQQQAPSIEAMKRRRRHSTCQRSRRDVVQTDAGSAVARRTSRSAMHFVDDSASGNRQKPRSRSTHAELRFARFQPDLRPEPIWSAAAHRSKHPS